MFMHVLLFQLNADIDQLNPEQRELFDRIMTVIDEQEQHRSSDCANCAGGGGGADGLSKCPEVPAQILQVSNSHH